MTCQIGDRVGALASTSNGIVKLLGYGVYDGDHTLPGAPTFETLWAEVKDEVQAKNPEMTEEKAREILSRSPTFKNPRITLDDGSVVWGKECWWAAEEKVKEQVKQLFACGWSVKRVRVVRDDTGRGTGFEVIED